jgi:hypothetical protein
MLSSDIEQVADSKLAISLSRQDLIVWFHGAAVGFGLTFLSSFQGTEKSQPPSLHTYDIDLSNHSSNQTPFSLESFPRSPRLFILCDLAHFTAPLGSDTRRDPSYAERWGQMWMEIMSLVSHEVEVCG